MSIYVRTKKFKNKDGSQREYLYLVESIWDPKTKSSKQRNICNLGRVDSKETSYLVDALIRNLSKFSENLKLIDACNDIQAKYAKTYGEIQIFRKLWKELGFQSILDTYFQKTKKQVPLTEAIFAMVCNRLIAPSSERQTNNWIYSVYEPMWAQYDLHHFYRALDFLIEHKEDIEIEMFESVKNLFNCRVNVVMFDTTTVSYWGEGSKAENLLDYGYAKNKRFDLKQMVIGIIMDQNGIPLGHEVWEGNKSDKPAFKEVIEKIRKKFMIDKVILVADRGMVSEENLRFLEESGYEYILGVKMRQLNHARKEILLQEEGFERLDDSFLKAKVLSEYELWERERIYKGLGVPTEAERLEFNKSPKSKRRWVACLNEACAHEDMIKRAYFRQIIENKIEFNTAKEWIIKNGYKKYVKIDNMEISLNEERLMEDELYDGKWVLITNSSLPVIDLIKRYKDLAKIERHFRDLKNELEVGPIYHQIEKRIRAHIYVCFLALQLKVGLTNRLKALDEDLSYSDVMRDVSKIKAVELEVNGQRVVMRTDVEGMAHLAFKAVKLGIPPKILWVDKNKHE